MAHPGINTRALAGTISYPGAKGEQTLGAFMEFQLHTTFPLHLETEWNALIERSITNVPFIRHEYLRTWWQTRGGGEWPQAELALVTAQREGSW
jgi:hypothetical protein